MSTAAPKLLQATPINSDKSRVDREPARDGRLSSASRIAPRGHAPLRGSRHLIPSTLRSGSATEDGEDGRA